MPGWASRPRARAVRLEGRYDVLETLAVDQAPPLHEALCDEASRPLWTYRPTDRPADVPAMIELSRRPSNFDEDCRQRSRLETQAVAGSEDGTTDQLREATCPTPDYRTEGAAMNDKTTLNGSDVEAARLADWRILFSALHARFETGSFVSGLELVNRIGVAAEEMNHHPDVDLTYPRVDVRLSSHDAGGVTERDIALARRISEEAEALGASARPDDVSVLEVALDTSDFAEIKPFWAALLGYATSDDAPGELKDPDGTMPTLWFQETDPHETPRQRYHFDLRVPPETADDRIRKALDAGGTLVSDASAPAFWVLADAQGNQACITTWLGRSTS